MVLDWPLVAFVAAPVLLGAFVGASTGESIKNWYNVKVRKPSFDPPNWVFGPVWTLLYALIGFASWLVWAQPGGFNNPAVRQALTWYAIQLGLNLLWAPLFFNAKKLGLALLDSAAILASATVTAILFHRIVPVAGQLMVPYVAWLVFALALTYRVWRLNPPELTDFAPVMEQGANPYARPAPPTAPLDTTGPSNAPYDPYKGRDQMGGAGASACLSTHRGSAARPRSGSAGAGLSSRFLGAPVRAPYGRVGRPVVKPSMTRVAAPTRAFAFV
jgi:benzodiazapine receptor